MAVSPTAGPNLIELTHEDTKITYALGVDGRPARVEYAGPMGRHSFEGDDIQAVESARGLEVSVTLDRVSFLRTITLTFFIPELELGSDDELSFRTIGIHSTRRRAITSSAGEPMTSEPLEFEGLARSIALHESGSTVLL